MAWPGHPRGTGGPRKPGPWTGLTYGPQPAPWTCVGVHRGAPCLRHLSPEAAPREAELRLLPGQLGLRVRPAQEEPVLGPSFAPASPLRWPLQPQQQVPLTHREPGPHPGRQWPLRWPVCRTALLHTDGSAPRQTPSPLPSPAGASAHEVGLVLGPARRALRGCWSGPCCLPGPGRGQ